MSTYTTSQVTIRPYIAQIDEAVAAYLQHENTMMTSESLASAATASIPVGTTSIEGMAMRFDRLAALPGGVGLIESTNSTGLQQAEQSRTQALAAVAAGRPEDAARLARLANSQLTAAVQPALQQLRTGERLFTDHTVTASLNALGYRVQRAQGTQCVGIYAERDHHAVAVRVNAGGTLELDVAGLAGSDCEAPIAALQAEMARRGLDCSIVAVHRHGDDRGGTLIRRAAKADAQDMAGGIVASYERTRHQPSDCLVPPPRQEIR